MQVGARAREYTIDVSGLSYTTWAESEHVYPGDFKLFITAYISYFRAGTADVSVLHATPQQIEWLLASPISCGTTPESAYVSATGFLMPPGCPQSFNGALVTTAPVSRQLRATAATAASVVAADDRRLTSWFPDVCSTSDLWMCIGFFPALELTATLPCGIVSKGLNALLPSPTATSTPLVVSHAAVAPPGRQLTFLSEDCPAAISASGSPTGFIGADTSAFGAWVGPAASASSTRLLFDTGSDHHDHDSPTHSSDEVAASSSTGSSEMLILFPAPCTRCNIYLKELWLSLARDCACDSVVDMTASVGLWSIAAPLAMPDCSYASRPESELESESEEAHESESESDAGTGGGHRCNTASSGAGVANYPAAYFTPAAGPQGATTKILLGATPATLVVNLGDGTLDAMLPIPYPGAGATQWIGVRLRASTCFKLGAGISAATFDPSCQCPDVVTTPVILMRSLTVTVPAHGNVSDTATDTPLAAETAVVWDTTCAVPAAFLPTAHVEPWLPACSAFPSPTAGTSASHTPTPTRTASPTTTFAVTIGPPASATQTRTASIASGFQLSAATGASSSSSAAAAPLTGGVIAAIVVGAVVGVAAVAAIAALLIVRARRLGGAQAAAGAPPVPVVV